MANHTYTWWYNTSPSCELLLELSNINDGKVKVAVPPVGVGWLSCGS